MFINSMSTYWIFALIKNSTENLNEVRAQIFFLYGSTLHFDIAEAFSKAIKLSYVDVSDFCTNLKGKS